MSAIKAGDLVMVVRPTPCCGWTEDIGTVYRVAELWHWGVGCPCEVCGRSDDPSPIAFNESKLGCEVSRLIRIDPPALPESVETDREVTA